MRHYGFPLNPVTFWEYYMKNTDADSMSKEKSAKYMVSIGVPKGDLLSPPLFTLL